MDVEGQRAVSTLQYIQSRSQGFDFSSLTTADRTSGPRRPWLRESLMVGD